MVEEKITPAKLADLAIMRAMGIPHEEIAQKLGVTTRTVERRVAEFRKRTEEVGTHEAFAEVIMAAGPFWVFRFTPLRISPEEITEELRKIEREK